MGGNIQFVPGASSSETKKESEPRKEPRTKRYAIGYVIGSVLLLAGYAGVMYGVEYFVLTQPAAELRDKKQQLKTANTEVLPQKTSVPELLASVQGLTRQNSQIASRLELLRQQNALDPDLSTLTYVAKRNSLEVQATASSPKAVTAQIQNLREKEEIASARADNRRQTDGGDQRFVLNLTFR